MSFHHQNKVRPLASPILPILFLVEGSHANLQKVNDGLAKLEDGAAAEMKQVD